MRSDKLKAALKFFSNKHNLLLTLILIIGIILMSAAPLSRSGAKESSVQTGADIKQEEERLAAVLSRIEGAGAVEVMISCYDSGRKDLAYEVKRQSKDNGSVSGGADESEDTKAVMSGGEPVVVAEQSPKVRGVIVVAQGAGAIEVKRALSEAAAAVTGAPACNVKVYEMKGK